MKLSPFIVLDGPSELNPQLRCQKMSSGSPFEVDPRPTLEGVVCPMLALWGSVDLEVDVPLAHDGFERVLQDRRQPGD